MEARTGLRVGSCKKSYKESNDDSQSDDTNDKEY